MSTPVEWKAAKAATDPAMEVMGQGGRKTKAREMDDRQKEVSDFGV